MKDVKVKKSVKEAYDQLQKVQGIVLSKSEAFDYLRFMSKMISAKSGLNLCASDVEQDIRRIDYDTFNYAGGDEGMDLDFFICLREKGTIFTEKRYDDEEIEDDEFWHKCSVFKDHVELVELYFSSPTSQFTLKRVMF